MPGCPALDCCRWRRAHPHRRERSHICRGTRASAFRRANSATAIGARFLLLLLVVVAVVVGGGGGGCVGPADSLQHPLRWPLLAFVAHVDARKDSSGRGQGPPHRAERLGECHLPFGRRDSGLHHVEGEVADLHYALEGLSVRAFAAIQPPANLERGGGDRFNSVRAPRHLYPLHPLTLLFRPYCQVLEKKLRVVGCSVDGGTGGKKNLNESDPQTGNEAAGDGAGAGGGEYLLPEDRKSVV